MKHTFNIPARIDVSSEENKAIIYEQQVVNRRTPSVNLDSLNLLLVFSFDKKLGENILAEDKDVWGKRDPSS